MYTREDVGNLMEAVKEMELGEMDFEEKEFGLGLDMFDPVTEQIFTLARPARRDVGQSEIFLSVEDARREVAGARLAHMTSVRLANYAAPVAQGAKETGAEEARRDPEPQEQVSGMPMSAGVAPAPVPRTDPVV